MELTDEQEKLLDEMLYEAQELGRREVEYNLGNGGQRAIDTAQQRMLDAKREFLASLDTE